MPTKKQYKRKRPVEDELSDFDSEEEDEHPEDEEMSISEFEALFTPEFNEMAAIRNALIRFKEGISSADSHIVVTEDNFESLRQRVVELDAIVKQQQFEREMHKKAEEEAKERIAKEKMEEERTKRLAEHQEYIKSRREEEERTYNKLRHEWENEYDGGKGIKGHLHILAAGGEGISKSKAQKSLAEIKRLTKLAIGSEYGTPNIYNLLGIRRPADVRKLWDAIEFGADVHAEGRLGEYPLHVAVSKHCYYSVRALLEAGASLEARIKKCKYFVDSEKTPVEMIKLDSFTLPEVYKKPASILPLRVVEESEEEEAVEPETAAPEAENEDDGEDGDEAQVDQWVQCDKCSKWRRLPQSIPSLPDQWFCRMNVWDLSHNNCSHEQEEMDE